MDLGRPVGGKPDAPFKIVAFVDFECPGCGMFHRVLEEVLRERNDVEAIYVHYPLSYHKFALPAARGAECAAEFGHFGSWASALFAKQDSLGIKSWGGYAMDAGIADTTRIVKCATESGVLTSMSQALELAERIDLDATPTILVNGWRLPGTPTKVEIDSVLLALGRSGNGTRLSGLLP